jgi:hypothetical protein
LICGGHGDEAVLPQTQTSKQETGLFNETINPSESKLGAAKKRLLIRVCIWIRKYFGLYFVHGPTVGARISLFTVCNEC